MGTTWSVRLDAARDADLRVLHVGIEAQLALVVAQMSTWEPNSDISRFNRSEAGHWQQIPLEFSQVLTCALEIAAASDGAFDPTIGTLVAAWGFGPHAHREAPDAAALDHARERTGWQRLAFDANYRLLQPGGLQLDLSAIAKGFAADRVATHLCSAGIPGALVEVGGELVGYGRKADGTAWHVLVEAGPEEEDHALEPRVLALDGIAVASSGDRWHHHTRGGRRCTHTIDPRSGEPVMHAPVAVTVVAGDAMHADAWATALSVLGVEAGHTLAQRLGLAARFLWREGNALEECMSDPFRIHLAA
ncbi:MAG: FAD:protein FMN transferase [Thermomonas sp.]|uniref:FAD:protein FMN transferase n=1 Tax=Thermomonas sp. TaxID=1971895 RepID=UPI0026247730|nr:FAD:protein FMN transferase [Thermomonas sp.]MCC7095762.1 FAD:protein FMN transferase [Thermomonas sp.]